MDLPALIDALSRPDAYPFATGDLDVRQTHISVVFLAGEFVFKVKKPVKLSFLDFSSLEKRRHFCDEEVRLNRRLAPNVYLGVVPIARDGSRLSFEGTGEVVDWAVKMRRLPEEATLEQYVARDAIDVARIESLARRVAGFHASAARSDHIAAFGCFEVVARNIRENFAVSEPGIGRTIDPAVRDRLIALFETSLHDLRAIIDSRSARGMPCDTHGDLHLDHVYLFPERPPPADLVIVDCIEFNERFRYTDPVADMAFLVMDLAFHGRRDLAGAFADAYFAAGGDIEGRGLLALYTAYRAAVRGKVDGLQMDEPEIADAARIAAGGRARAHWLLALQELEVPERRACLILVGGLPGTGKSTLAKGLAARAGFEVIRSDMVRKELAGVAPHARAGGSFGEGLYTSEWTDRTYAECLRRAEERLFAGKRVIVDATFADEERRQTFLDAARRWGVPALLLVCTSDPQTIKTRLEARRGDASDADWSIYLEAAQRWQPPSKKCARASFSIATDGPAEAALEQAGRLLADEGLGRLASC